MRLATLISNTILGIMILALCPACSGQTRSTIAGRNADEQSSAMAMGDMVATLDKKIFIVFQASNNNYWFGSDGQGVYHYDGQTMLHFTTRHGLSNDTIREIQEDASGNIYFTTHDGISKFDGKRITRLPVAKAKISDWKLLPGDLWFKGEPGKNGPYRYDGKTLYHLEFPKHYLEDEFNAGNPNARHIFSPYEVYHIYKDSKGNIWFGTSAFGICRFNGKALSWMYEEHLTKVAGGGSFGIRSINEDKEGKFWICNSQYRYNIDPTDSTGKTHSFIRYRKENGLSLPLPDGKDHPYFLSITKDDEQNLWMATYDRGVWRYDGKNATHYPVKKGGKDITVFTVYNDNSGHLWLGTHESGAYKFNGKSFEPFTF